MLSPYAPSVEELWFRQRMLADPETMSYNRAWGGPIPFPILTPRRFSAIIDPSWERRYTDKT